MRTLLICHEEANLDREGLARWLASFSNLVGIVILRETRQQVWRRLRREFKRVGILRFLDVLAFRFYYAFFLAKKDQAWEKKKLEALGLTYPLLREHLPVLYTHSPNSPEAEQFLERLNPDIVLARCKFILKERIFRIARKGTFVLHPGICPEYRNAHGCFWALVNRDLAKVGVTLLQTDAGVDTGPVYGYYTYPYDELNESHIVIQHRAVLDNLIPLQNKFMEIYSGSASRVDTSGRNSALWGQPWLTRYLKWKSEARKRLR
jgi:Formyl transferase